MINFTCRVLEAGLQIFRLQIRQLFKNLFAFQAGGKKIENIGNSDTHSPDAGTASALIGVNSDAGREIPHILSVSRLRRRARARGSVWHISDTTVLDSRGKALE